MKKQNKLEDKVDSLEKILGEDDKVDAMQKEMDELNDDLEDREEEIDFLKNDLSDRKKKIAALVQQVTEAKDKDVHMAKLDDKMRGMEEEMKTTQALFQNYAF